MTTADRHTDTDRPEGGAYRASDVDTTAQDDAARYEDVDGGGTGEPGGYARHHDDADTTDSTSDGYSGAQRLDAQDADDRGGYARDGHGTFDRDHDAASATTTGDEPRTEGGYPASADSLGHSTDHADRTDDDAAGRHADQGVRTVDVGSDGTHDSTHDGTHDGTRSTDHSGAAAAAGTAAGTATTGTTTTGTTSGTTDADRSERLVPSARAQEYSSRWDAVKGEFVDEPRQAVAKADKLVGELLDELDQLFRKQRSDLEHGLDKDETSTEDLRLALRRYRSFFDRLLQL